MEWTAAEQVHRALLTRWRTAMNLVGPGDVEHHFVDSAGAVIGLHPQGRWVDLGSGAGFPGIALAARHPETRVVLVESREKRVSFLRQVIRESGLSNVSLFHGRTESVTETFDGVISRAYRPPESYLEDAARLLTSTGVAVLLSGDAPPQFPGWVVDSCATYGVPGGQRTRTVLRRR